MADSQEKPRDVYTRACAEIGMFLQVEGFKYSPSQFHAVRRSGDFKLQVSFQSSHSNVSGQYVALWIHATVFSRKLKAWREAQNPGARTSGFVAGGQIGNLREPARWLTWDLADPGSRPQVVSRAISTIQDVAFPFFAQFDDVKSMLARMRETVLTAHFPEKDLEFALCFGGRDEANEFLQGFFTRRPDLLSQFFDEVSVLLAGAESSRPRSGYAATLAALAVKHGLTLPSNA